MRLILDPISTLLLGGTKLLVRAYSQIGQRRQRLENCSRKRGQAAGTEGAVLKSEGISGENKS